MSCYSSVLMVSPGSEVHDLAAVGGREKGRGLLGRVQIVILRILRRRLASTSSQLCLAIGQSHYNTIFAHTVSPFDCTFL